MTLREFLNRIALPKPEPQCETIADNNRYGDKVCGGSPDYYCADCDEQICHYCAHAEEFHGTHHVLEIYKGDTISRLTRLVCSAEGRA